MFFMITEQISMASGTALLQCSYSIVMHYTSSFKSISQKQRPLEACFCILHVMWCDVMCLNKKYVLWFFYFLMCVLYLIFGRGQESAEIEHMLLRHIRGFKILWWVCLYVCLLKYLESCTADLTQFLASSANFCRPDYRPIQYTCSNSGLWTRQ